MCPRMTSLGGMMKYRIHTTQQLDENGRIGAWLFVGSPVVSGLCYYWFQVQAAKTYGGNIAPPAIFMALAGVAFLVGCILLLVGRSQSHTVFEAESTYSNGDQWP